MSTLALNKRGLHDYAIEDKYDAGLVLLGHEVKSVKTGHITLKGSYVTIKINQRTSRPEAWLLNAYIPPYQKAGPLPSYEPRRSRKLLLTKKELKSLIGKRQEKGLTLVPIKVYTKHKLLKLEFGLGLGKKKFDKREEIKKKDANREMQRMIRRKK